MYKSFCTAYVQPFCCFTNSASPTSTSSWTELHFVLILFFNTWLELVVSSLLIIPFFFCVRKVKRFISEVNPPMLLWGWWCYDLCEAARWHIRTGMCWERSTYMLQASEERCWEDELVGYMRTQLAAIRNKAISQPLTLTEKFILDRVGCTTS